MCTSVASRVHGTTGLPCSKCAVVGEDDVTHNLGELRREALDLLDHAAAAVVAERDLAVQPARVGQVDAAALPALVLVGLKLSYVVQQRTRDRDVAVDAREADGT
jgi:hypothetical protein